MSARDTRITVARTEDLAAVVAKVLSCRTPRAVLTVPSGALIGAAPENFQLLRREAEAAGIVIGVESIDDHILALASGSGIPAANPVFRARERSMSDIIARPTSSGTGRMTRVVSQDVTEPKITTESVATRSEQKKSKSDAEVTPVPVTPTAARRRAEKQSENPAPASDEVPPTRSARGLKFGRGILAVVIILAASWWVGGTILSRVTVEGTIVRVPVPFEEQVRTMISQTMPDITGPVIMLPAQSFDARKNVSMTFTAAGRVRAETKASGTLVIMNAYSSEPQVLVATTRFVSPEGALFRLAARTVVAGARIEDGVIRPASTTVHVVADEPGERFNVPASSGWKIPGFEGTPKYQAFLVTAPEPLRGGFVGEMPMPTDEERASATVAVDAALKSALETELSLVRTERFVRPPDAVKFTVLRREFSPGEEPGTFRIFAEASLSELVFDEHMLTEAIFARTIKAQGAPPLLDSVTISYGTSTLNASSSALALRVSGTLTLRQQFDTDSFLDELKGRPVSAFPEILARHPELHDAALSTVPFWVWKIPDDSGRITLSIR